MPRPRRRRKRWRERERRERRREGEIRERREGTRGVYKELRGGHMMSELTPWAHLLAYLLNKTALKNYCMLLKNFLRVYVCMSLLSSKLYTDITHAVI